MNGSNEDRKWLRDWYLENAISIPAGNVSKPEFTKPIKRCVNNSIEALVENKITGNKSEYFEGFVVVHFPIIHAWNRINDKWFDYTIRNANEYAYFGVNIPASLIVLASIDRAWAMSTGVLQTVAFTRDRKLVESAKNILLGDTAA